MSKTKILICTHKEYTIPQNDIFMPIHVGKALSDKDLGIQGDDTGDNISAKNPIYCELTALYWAWKNLPQDIEYVGLCHYRRYFSFRSIGLVNSIRRSRAIVKTKIKSLFSPIDIHLFFNAIENPEQERFQEIVDVFENDFIESTSKNNYDIYCLKPVLFIGGNVRTFFNILSRYHIDTIELIIKEDYSDYFKSFENILKGDKLSYANMAIMKREYFDEYCSFIFGVLDKYEKKVINDGWCSNHAKDKSFSRIPAYMGELLTATYISYAKSGGKKIKYLSTLNYGV